MPLGGFHKVCLWWSNIFLCRQEYFHPCLKQTEMGTKPDLEKVKSFLSNYLPICHFPIVILYQYAIFQLLFFANMPFPKCYSLPICHLPIVIFCASSLEIKKKKRVLELRDGQNQRSQNKLLHWMSR